MRQIKRWIYAAKQNIHPGISLLHANYAVGDIDMLRQMASDTEVKRITGENPHTLYLVAIALQDKAQKKLTAVCPQLEVEL